LLLLGVVRVDVAGVLLDIADLLDLEGEAPDRARSFQDAARSLIVDAIDAATMLDSPHPPEVRNTVGELLTHGRARVLDELVSRQPLFVRRLTAIPSLRTGRVARAARELGLSTIQELAQAATDGRVRKLHGFGVKTERQILQALSAAQSDRRTLRLDVADEAAHELADWLRGAPGVRRLEWAGQLRRREEVVETLHGLAVTDEPLALVGRLLSFHDVAEVVRRSRGRALVRLFSGATVDVEAVPAECFGVHLFLATGPEAHVSGVRALAGQRHLEINGLGVFHQGAKIGGDEERSVYGAVGLDFVEPELRTGGDEIEAAAAGTLPKLVTAQDLHGDLHVHVDFAQEGALEAFANAALGRGLSWLGVLEKTPQLSAGLARQHLQTMRDEIARVQQLVPGVVLLLGAEVEPLADGTPLIADDVLEALDFAVVALHSRFDLDAEAQTRRLCRALDHPAISGVAHPTGRLVDGGAPYRVDIERLLHHARRRGAFVELNAQPDRFDLEARACRLAKEAGVTVSIASDAEAPTDLELLDLGVSQARRGWLEPHDVLNHLQVHQLLGRLHEV
jgi:DNA polymerase (family 10)